MAAIIIMYPSICQYLVDNILPLTLDGWLTTLLVVHNSYPPKMSKIVAVHPLVVTDQTLGVVVVQALKLKVGYHGHWCYRAQCVYGVGVCML